MSIIRYKSTDFIRPFVLALIAIAIGSCSYRNPFDSSAKPPSQPVIAPAVRGHVSNTNGASVSGAVVRPLGMTVTTTTDAQGYFAPPLQTPGPWYISAAGYQSVTSSTLAETVLWPMPAATISGSIIGVIGKPLGGAVISLNGGVVTTTSAVDGTFTIGNVSPGNVTLMMQCQSYVPYISTLIISSGTNLQVPRVTLAEGTAVFGTVTNAVTSKQIAGVTVSVASLQESTTTDQYGNFNLPLPNATQQSVIVTVSAAGYQSAAFNFNSGPGAQSLNVRLQPAWATVFGIVVNQSGSSLPGASVSIDGALSNYTTDASGRFALTAIPVGQHTLGFNFTSGGYVFTNSVQIQVGRTPLSITAVIRIANHVFGRILTNFPTPNNPPSYCLVNMSGTTQGLGSIWIVKQADAGGNFDFGLAMDRPVTLTVRATDFFPQQYFLDFTGQGGDTPIQIVLAPHPVHVHVQSICNYVGMTPNNPVCSNAKQYCGFFEFTGVNGDTYNIDLFSGQEDFTLSSSPSGQWHFYFHTDESTDFGCEDFNNFWNILTYPGLGDLGPGGNAVIDHYEQDFSKMCDWDKCRSGARVISHTDEPPVTFP